MTVLPFAIYRNYFISLCFEFYALLPAFVSKCCCEVRQYDLSSLSFYEMVNETVNRLVLVCRQK